MAVLTARDYRLCPNCHAQWILPNRAICLLCETTMKSNGSLTIQQIATQCGLTVTSINRWKADGSLPTYGSPARAKTEDARKCAKQHGYHNAFPEPPEDEETLEGPLFISFKNLFELCKIPESIQPRLLKDLLRTANLPTDTPADEVDFKLPESIDAFGGRTMPEVFQELALSYVE